ncbi:glycosyltransferase [Rhizobium sp. VS19-DR104.2]|uniref:glycosyltransferase family 2 protein n=1 Tax=unclassified Rhizobium TaxID=2613769 RepID=UPI001CC4E948|nr:MULTISPECIES: glycosyltransferase [unclassified Rhizobium]MBZ5763441.1 glycosyltransferase [Rhizobium sp. VS19-DR96]MBZ5769336.1 glycosyltransferase [Rhizobium sp. VS19-DR129.2]MBZ5776906.1 glycosyltransferase [Rhizobium sp. VS19-DRK62.2]MBZ5788005.1 glycosyltransferase [Rhizobium sp. VS19-DR121]MBZ5805485.1 glycosyltransferase [Rhizobium sp. VS19-DR181]
MDKSPFFSVVVPLYNRVDCIVATLQSVLDQSFGDFEIVVVDDGSIDEPRTTVDAMGDPRIRFFSQVNAGGSAARNKGIDLARGHYIAFLDSDDRFLPNHLETMHDVLSRNPQSDLSIYSPVIVDRGDGKTFVKPPRAIGVNEDMADYVMRDRGFIQTSGLVVPREIAAKVRYRTGLPFGQDTDFAVRLFRAGSRFQMTETPTVVWNDAVDPKRVSAARKGHRIIGWLEEMKPLISRKAYLGYRGWHVAKGLAPQQPSLAMRYYLSALFSGCYGPKLAFAVLLQIALPDEYYRRFSDLVIGLARRNV